MIALQIIGGALVAILVTIWVENNRKPRLELKIGPPVDMNYKNRPAETVRFLGLDLHNKPLPRGGRWMSRSAAVQCHGSITFHHTDGQNVFGRSMPIRWTNSPEPASMVVKIGEKLVSITDPARFTFTPRMDIYPSEAERLDIAAKFDNEPECYGWCNENYVSSPTWRNPRWKLDKDRYLVKITVTSGGERRTALFRLINDVNQQDFRLEQPLEKDVAQD